MNKQKGEWRGKGEENASMPVSFLVCFWSDMLVQLITLEHTILTIDPKSKQKKYSQKSQSILLE